MLVLILSFNGFKMNFDLYFWYSVSGLVKPLESLVSNIESPVYGLQCTVDAPLESINDLASFYITHIQSVQAKGPYHIAGYSFGASVAFEVATQLESQGEEVASLVMLDGSHSYVTAHVEQYVVRDTDTAKHEAEALSVFVLQFTTIDYAKVRICL